MIFIKNQLRYLFVAMWNHFFCHIPSYIIRYILLKYLYRAKLGRCSIHSNVKFFSPWKLTVGDYSNIQMNSFIDCRGGVKIGNNVDITLGVKILSQYHEIDSVEYKTISRCVIVDDYAVIGSFSNILPGVVISKGCVIGAGSTVVKSTTPFSLFAGNPAVFKRERNCKLVYKPLYKRPFH